VMKTAKIGQKLRHVTLAFIGRFSKDPLPLSDVTGSCVRLYAHVWPTMCGKGLFKFSFEGYG
jgi:hypothetical protein